MTYQGHIIEKKTKTQNKNIDMFHFSRFPRLRGKWVQVGYIENKRNSIRLLILGIDLFSSFCSANPEMFYLTHAL